jgi:hypothetical protein
MDVDKEPRRPAAGLASSAAGTPMGTSNEFRTAVILAGSRAEVA